MTAVVAARWDVTWDRGGGWWVRLGRRTRGGLVLALADPCALQVRPVDGASAVAPLLDVPGVLGTGGDDATFTVTAAQIETLPWDAYEYRALGTDALSALPLVLLRGYVKIRDRVGDD